jgi:hypothetical protein
MNVSFTALCARRNASSSQATPDFVTAEVTQILRIRLKHVLPNVTTAMNAARLSVITSSIGAKTINNEATSL